VRQLVSESESEDEEGRADRTPRQRVASRVVYGTFLGVATAFILSSTVQIIVAVFGLDAAPLGGQVASPVGDAPGSPVAANARACTEGIARLAGALDRSFARTAIAQAAGDDGPRGIDREEALAASFRKDLAPEWDTEKAVEASCAGDTRSEDAFAALLRLKWAQEGFVRRQMVEIEPLRREVRAYLPRLAH